MNTKRLYSFLMGIILVFPLIGQAAIASWKMDPAKSQLQFTGTQNGSPVTGQFKSFTGDILFDPKQLPASRFKIVVEMASVSTSYGEVADTLKTPDWFNVKSFPQATYETSSFKNTGDKNYQAQGTLTIRNISMPVVLDFTLESYTDNQLRFTGSTMLKRTQFGVGQGDWKSTDDIKDDVKVSFTVEAVKS